LHVKEPAQEQVELKGILSKVRNAYCLADKSKQSLAFRQNKENLSISIPEELRQPRITVVVLEIADNEARVIDETLQQLSNGVIQLPVEKCEFATRRTSYDYEEKVTQRWGENSKQGLIWTVNVTSPGDFRVISEDNGENRLQYNIVASGDTLLLNAKGEIDVMSKKEHEGTIHISQSGDQTILVYPKVRAEVSRRYKFKGLELIPIQK
ncbi:MAG: hypothetical protein KAS71_09160, partial [Bacteroidales bacterium]|nr:hypothetical protein [Bacteroidales bacterium]